MSLRAQLNEIAQSFADQIFQAIRGMSLDRLVEETGRGAAAALKASPKLSVAKAEPRAASAPARAKRGKGGRLARRSADDIAGVVDQIVALLQATAPEGLRAEEIRASLKLEAKEMPRPLAEALAAKKIRKQGEKRATTYFVRSAGASAKPAKKTAKVRAKKTAAPKKTAKTKSATANGLATAHA